MARLNEPAPSIESIESLKRRFLRQNRDIARANSAQSMRIRSLENEMSRLLTENLALRGQIIRLQNELENDKAHHLVENTRATKSQLEAKLLELGALISGLGNEPEQKSIKGGRVVRESPSRSPTQRDWRNMYTMSEVVRGLEGPLPPIMENKTYPRKTLELHDLEAIITDGVEDTTDSPDIGSPPISQFVDEDAVKVDLPVRPRKLESGEVLDFDPVFSVNLEQRKKRKDSINDQELRANQAESEKIEKESTNPLKTGAKRKLSVRDDDEGEIPMKENRSSPDDFKFIRVISDDKSKSKVASQLEKPANKEAREYATAKGATRDRQFSSITPTSRTALAAKSVNNSPRKSTKSVTSDSIKGLKDEAINPKPIGRPRGRPRNDSHNESIKPAPGAALKKSEVQTDPKSCTELDAISAPFPEPSTSTGSRDTPPPSDLGSNDESIRPNRRSRPSVSYTEPNLRAKMRRPTNEFVDAVAVGDQKHPDVAIKTEDQNAPKSAKVKMEAKSDGQLKSRSADLGALENSPLKGKASAADTLPSSITTHRKRRESILTQSETEFRGQGSAIAALLAEKRRVKADAREKELQSKEAKGKDNVDIYEFRCSSPETQEGASGKSKDAKPASRSSRRHTAMGRDMAYVDESDASDVEPWRKSRHSSLSLRSSVASAESEKERGDGEKSLRKSTSTASMADPSASRADRTAARRRSMML